MRERKFFGLSRGMWARGLPRKMFLKVGTVWRTHSGRRVSSTARFMLAVERISDVLGVPIQEGLPPGNPTPFGKSIRETAAPALRPEVQRLVRSQAMEVPEWKAQEQSYELQKARDILRNANATDEDKAVAQARLTESQ
jgi:hypothetical protein